MTLTTGRGASPRRPDILAVEWVSMCGLTGWMLSTGLSVWLRSPYETPAAYAAVAPIDWWQAAAASLAIAKAGTFLLAYRRERWASLLRRGIMLAAVFWWVFVIYALAAHDPLAPALGAYLGCAFASAWAFYKVTLRRAVGGGG